MVSNRPKDPKVNRQITSKKEKKMEQHMYILVRDILKFKNNRHRFFRYQPLSNSTSSRSRCVKTWRLLSVYLPIYKSVLTVIWIWPWQYSKPVDWLRWEVCKKEVEGVEICPWVLWWICWVRGNDNVDSTWLIRIMWVVGYYATRYRDYNWGW